MSWEIMKSYSATEKEEILPWSQFEKKTMADAIHPPKMLPFLPHPLPPAKWKVILYKSVPDLLTFSDKRKNN